MEYYDNPHHTSQVFDTHKFVLDWMWIDDYFGPYKYAVIMFV